MVTNIVTVEDLENFRHQLLSDLQKILVEKEIGPGRKWLKSHEVRRLLRLSPGTLQNLRINGTLPFTKIGGVIFYDYDDIQNMIEKHRQSHEFPSQEA